MAMIDVTDNEGYKRLRGPQQNQNQRNDSKRIEIETKKKNPNRLVRLILSQIVMSMLNFFFGFLDRSNLN